MAVREAIDGGQIPGPRLFLAGRLLSITTATVAYYPGMYEVADGPDEVRRAVRRQLAQGADLIKVMATGAMLSSETEDARAIQYGLDELRAAVEVAHASFKPVAAHAHALQGILNAVEAGVDSIEHCTFADDDALARIARAGTFVVPTICAGELLFRDQAIVDAMPAHLRQRMAEFNDVHLATIRRAHEVGARIAMGTDAGTPGNHHGLNAHECVLMSTRCGLSPAESIRTATANAAALLRREGDLGRLGVGALRGRHRLRGRPVRRHRGADAAHVRDEGLARSRATIGPERAQGWRPRNPSSRLCASASSGTGMAGPQTPGPRSASPSAHGVGGHTGDLVGRHGLELRAARSPGRCPRRGRRGRRRRSGRRPS